MVHHLGDKTKRALKNGFTIMKDQRFMNDNDLPRPMREEQELIYDMKRKPRTIFVTKNEYRRREFYQKFYNIIKETGLIKTFWTNPGCKKEGLLKIHPMKSQKDKDKLLISTQLRFNLNKAQWIKVEENKSFKDVIITMQLGKTWIKHKELAKEIIVYANEEGTFIMREADLKTWERRIK